MRRFHFDDTTDTADVKYRVVALNKPFKDQKVCLIFARGDGSVFKNCYSDVETLQ